jgi:xanthine/CO dehydrogenase XdhC/CoxF family maturation factor
MNENAAILAGFDAACAAEGRPVALATVVRVEGSSYRRPGARMLIAGDGRTWGGVSGGCLERDVARRGRGVIDSGAAEIRRYDTTDDFGEGATLGCAGMIDLFIERISAGSPGPMPALRRAVVERRAVTLGTVLRSGGTNRPPGTRFALAGAREGSADADLEHLLREASAKRTCSVCSHAGAEIFVETIVPPQSLVIFGGGPDVVPVVEIARTLGWHVTVIASHGAVGFERRFAAADVVARGSDEEPLGGVAIEAGAAVVLMTHHYPRDLSVLPRLLAMPLAYLGALGPRRRAERLVLECPGVPADAIDRLHAPAGLDLGASTPGAIALAIVAEIQAVLAGRPRVSLRDRPGPIYPGDHRDAEAAADARPYPGASCPLSA